MKCINLSIGLFVLLTSLSCGQSSVKKETPKPQIAEIKFQDEVIVVGITDGKSNVNVDFKFKNTGAIPLVIKEVKGNCHCVQGKALEQTVAPGDSSAIIVSFDPEGVSGSYQRTLMVESNATTPSVELYIRGDIQRDPKEVIKKTH